MVKTLEIVHMFFVVNLVKKIKQVYIRVISVGIF